MTQYCNTGELARVTLPDNEIREYQNTPIDITVVENLHQYRITAANQIWQDNAAGGYIVTQNTGSTFFAARVNDLPVPFYKTYVNTLGRTREYDLNINAFPFTNSIAKSDIRVVGYASPIPNFFVKPNFIYNNNTAFYIIQPTINGVPGYQPTFVLTIRDNSNTVVFTKTYTTEQFLVECIEVCPPDTIDCEDGCCLPCQPTLDELCNLLAIFGKV